MSEEQLRKIAETVSALADKVKFNKIESIYPAVGPYSRDHYKKHMEFFRAGANHRFRMLIGANRSGKSFSGAVELVYHMTGEYPEWWEGKRLRTPKTVWIVCESGQLWMQSLQRLLICEPGEEIGTGLVPKDKLKDVKALPGVPGAYGSFLVKHKKGHYVSVNIKTNEMTREQFQAAKVDLIVFDEEPAEHIYTECMMRLMGTAGKEPGISMILFTPLKGMSNIVLQYLPNGQFPNGEVPGEPEKYVVNITWDDIPHLTQEDKEAMMALMTPQEREARTRGVPSLGSGRVFPIFEEDIKVNFLKIGSHWPRAYGLDVGWECTAGIWGAKDPETGVIYLYGEYYKGQQAPYVHAHAILAKGNNIPGIADSAAGHSSVRDGSSILDEYNSLGLNLISAPKGPGSVAAGNARILQMLESGLLKVCYNLEHWWTEFRTYRYDKNDPNKIARNQKDHLMDATRYLISKFDQVAVSPDDLLADDEAPARRYVSGRNNITGY